MITPYVKHLRSSLPSVQTKVLHFFRRLCTMDGEGSGASSSLEEARLRNIARNNDFLRSLFGPSEVVVQNEVEKLESGATQASSEKSITFEKLRIETTRSLAQQFSLRDAEIRELVSFVTSVS